MRSDLAEPALAVVSIALALVFAAAGLAKLRQPGPVVDAFEKFRVPRLWRNRTAARALALYELCLALGLLAADGSLFLLSAIASTVACGLFVVVTCRAWRRGEDFDCGCFGGAATPISGMLVLRNVVLLAGSGGAVVLASDGFGGVVRAVQTFTAEDGTWGIVALFLVALATTLTASTPRRSVETLLASEAGALTATRLPDLYFTTHMGDPVRIREMLSDAPAHLVVLVRPGCRSCEALLDEADVLRSRLAAPIGMILVIAGDQESFAKDHADLAASALFGGWTLAEYLRVSAYPGAVLVDSSATILAEPVSGSSAIQNLAADAGAAARART